jgi:hypothetical protein
VTAALVGLGFAIALVLALWGNWRRLASLLAALAGGFGVVAGAALAIGGSAMLKTTSQASDLVSIGSPWRVIRTALQHTAGYGSAADIVKYGAIVLAIVLAVLLVRALSRVLAVGGGAEPAVVPLALVLGWLFAWPYVLPWYDALGWALLALVPASDVDWLLLARTAALGFAYLPARTRDVTLPHGLNWLQPVFRHGMAPVVLAGAIVWLVVLMWRAGTAPGVVTSSDDAKRILAGRRGVRSDHPE